MSENLNVRPDDLDELMPQINSLPRVRQVHRPPLMDIPTFDDTALNNLLGTEIAWSVSYLVHFLQMPCIEDDFDADTFARLRSYGGDELHDTDPDLASRTYEFAFRCDAFNPDRYSTMRPILLNFKNYKGPNSDAFRALLDEALGLFTSERILLITQNYFVGGVDMPLDERSVPNIEDRLAAVQLFRDMILRILQFLRNPLEPSRRDVRDEVVSTIPSVTEESLDSDTGGDVFGLAA